MLCFVAVIQQRDLLYCKGVVMIIQKSFTKLTYPPVKERLIIYERRKFSHEWYINYSISWFNRIS